MTPVIDKRHRLTMIHIEYYCPVHQTDKAVEWDGDGFKWHDVLFDHNECDHCGIDESFRVQVECECGKSHYLTLFSYRSG